MITLQKDRNEYGEVLRLWKSRAGNYWLTIHTTKDRMRHHENAVNVYGRSLITPPPGYRVKGEHYFYTYGGRHNLSDAPRSICSVFLSKEG